jgi:hypothetical protein
LSLQPMVGQSQPHQIRQPRPLRGSASGADRTCRLGCFAIHQNRLNLEEWMSNSNNESSFDPAEIAAFCNRHCDVQHADISEHWPGQEYPVLLSCLRGKRKGETPRSQISPVE